MNSLGPDHKRRYRVGRTTDAHFDRTGTPVFVVATTADLPVEPIELQDASRLLDVIPADTHLVDRLLHLAVRGFFRLGGERLVILPISIDGSTDDLSREFLNRVMGEDAGFLKRSGYHALKNFDRVADLAVFPQAPVILSAHELSYLYGSALASLETHLPSFLIMDTPCFSSIEKATAWAGGLRGAAGAVFYPWISVGGVGFLPVSVLVAAFLQNSDARHGVAEPPANRALPAGFEPLAQLRPPQVQSLMAARVNCVRRLPDGTLTLWGTHTTAAGGDVAFVHVVRALRTLQDAIERTCEPFLMEARTPTTCTRLEQATSGVLEEAEAAGLIAARGEQHRRGFSVACAITPARGVQDPVLNLDVEVAVENPELRVGLRLNL